jgi:peptidoglycan/LPS O-acetylase OafA/YrhL
VLCHFGGLIGPRFAAGSTARVICDAFVHYGSLGTDTFFVLAAYLLCRSLAKGSTWKEAVGRRILKFYPGFVAILTLYLLLSRFAPVSKLPADGVGTAVYVAANLLLLPGLLPIESMVAVAWSLSYIAVGYVLVGGLYRLSTRRGWSGAQRGLLWAAMAVAIWGSSQFGLPYQRMMFFPLGALLCEVAPARYPRARFFTAVAAMLLLSIVMLPESASRAIAITLGAAATIGFTSFRPPIVASLFADLSQISYAVFLSHGLVLHLIRLAGPATATLADLGALLLVTLSLVLVAAVAFRAAVLEPLESMLVHRSSMYGTTARQSSI